MKIQSDLHLYPPEESSRMVQKTRHDRPRNVFPSIGECTSFCNGERFQQKNRK